MFFDDTITVRIRSDEKKDILRLLDNPDADATDLSHFARAALIREIRRQKEAKNVY